ncbi:MAG TPA: hypothetical protein ENN12_01050 [Epsilonproteobacteria bacterium]|nr:hypothetical protein [Campylobacterota bacterium]
MKRNSFYAFIVIALLGFSGCATQENFAKQYNSWIGKDINGLIDQIGYPDSSFEAPNGNKVYVYNYNRVDSAPMMTPTFGFGYGWYGRHHPILIGVSGYHTTTRTCKLFIEVDSKDIITKWSSRGNSCVAYPIKEKSGSNSTSQTR